MYNIMWNNVLPIAWIDIPFEDDGVKMFEIWWNFFTNLFCLCIARILLGSALPVLQGWWLLQYQDPNLLLTQLYKICWPYAVWMLGQRRRRWSNI